MTLAGSCLVYWFSGAAVGFCGLLLYFLFAKKPLFSLPKLFLLGGGAIAIILLTTWRVSKTFLLGTGKTQFAQLRRPSVSEIDLGIIEIPIQKWQYIMSFSDLNSMFSTLLIPSSIFLCALGSALICKKRFRTLLLILVTITIPIEGAIVFQYGTWFPTGYAFLHSIFPPLPRCTVPHRMMVSSLLIILLIIGWGSNTIVQNGKSIPTRILRMLIIFMGLYSLLQEQIPNMKQGNTSRHSKDRSYLQYTQQFPGGIIDVPLIASQKTYVQQRYHKQMIIGGPGQDSVRPQAHRRYYQKNTLLLALEGLAERGKGRSIREGDQQKLWDDGFRLIVVHLDMSNSRQESYEELLKTEGILDKKKNRLYIEIKPEK
jgi:hypothetical protein